MSKNDIILLTNFKTEGIIKIIMKTEGKYMADQEQSLRMHEYQTQLENVHIQLLVDKPWSDQGISEPLPLHNHVFVEIFACEKGELVLKTANGYVTLNPGDAAVVPPKVPHIKHQTKTPSEGCTLGFVCRPKNGHTNSALYRRLRRFTDGTQILVYRNQPFVFESIQTITSSAEASEYLLPVVYLSELLLKLLTKEYETYETADTENRSASQSQSAQNLLRMRELDNLIDSDYTKKWNTADVAKKLFLSARQLDRIALKRYGKTLHQVIVDKRIKTAENLLVTTDMTVEKIAITVGFNSSVGFYREFTKRYGMTPAEYRKAVISGSL